MKLGTETGNVVSSIMANSVQPVAEVGMAATVCFWTDRHAATVIKVTRCTVTVQEDTATRTDKLGMSDCQDYTYERNPNGRTHTFRMTKRGRWHAKTAAGLVLGRRDEHYDFSF